MENISIAGKIIHILRYTKFDCIYKIKILKGEIENLLSGPYVKIM